MSDQMDLPIAPNEDVTIPVNTLFCDDEDMARYEAGNEEHEYLGDDDE